MGSDFTIGKEKHIKYILDNFNFTEVNRVMTILDWHWWSAVNKVPSVDELKKEAKRMLNDIYDNEYTSSSTGGFKVAKFEDHLELQFIISDKSSSLLNLTDDYLKLKEKKVRKKKLETIQKLNENEENN